MIEPESQIPEYAAVIIELLKDLNKMLKKEVDSLQKELQKTKNEISNN